MKKNYKTTIWIAAIALMVTGVASASASEEDIQDMIHDLGYEYIGWQEEDVTYRSGEIYSDTIGMEQEPPTGVISAEEADLDGDGDDELLLVLLEETEREYDTSGEKDARLAFNVYENQDGEWEESQSISTVKRYGTDEEENIGTLADFLVSTEVYLVPSDEGYHILVNHPINSVFAQSIDDTDIERTEITYSEQGMSGVKGTTEDEDEFQRTLEIMLQDDNILISRIYVSEFVDTLYYDLDLLKYMEFLEGQDEDVTLFIQDFSNLSGVDEEQFIQEQISEDSEEHPDFGEWVNWEFDNGNTYTGFVGDDGATTWGTYTWSDGCAYEGQFEKDLFNGYGIDTSSDGHMYKGGFSDDKREGWGALYYPDGIVFIGEFVDGHANGLGVILVDDEINTFGTFEDGELIEDGIEHLLRTDAGLVTYGFDVNGSSISGKGIVVGSTFIIMGKFTASDSEMISGEGLTYNIDSQQLEIGTFEEGGIEEGFVAFPDPDNERYLIGDFKDGNFLEGFKMYSDGYWAIGSFQEDGTYISGSGTTLEEVATKEYNYWREHQVQTEIFTAENTEDENGSSTIDLEQDYGNWVEYDSDAGGYYSGFEKDGEFNGWGNYTFSNGAMYEGQFEDGVLSGFGTYILPDNIMYIGEVYDGERCGIGVSFYPDDDYMSIGEIDDNGLNGLAVELGDSVQFGIYEDNVRVDDGYENCQQNDDGSMYYWVDPDNSSGENKGIVMNTDDLRIGIYPDGTSGRSLEFWQDGDLYIGDLNNDVYEGEGVYYYGASDDILYAIGSFENGEFTQGVMKHSDGAWEIGQFQNDVYIEGSGITSNDV